MKNFVLFLNKTVPYGGQTVLVWRSMCFKTEKYFFPTKLYPKGDTTRYSPVVVVAIGRPPAPSTHGNCN